MTRSGNGQGRSGDKAPQRYHHGDLKRAMLDAAEKILAGEGIAALTLRRAAREAGASHAAPKNHFGDLSGLLSELAAIGFVRLRAAMEEATAAERNLHALGRSYVLFARANPALFLLMFRSDRLDMCRPALREAADSVVGLLARSVEAAGHSGASDPDQVPLQMAKAWAQVHGLAMLSIDGRLAPILARLPGEADEEELVSRLLDER